MSADPNKKKRQEKMRTLRLDIVATLYKRGYSYRAIREEVMAPLDLPAYSLRTVHKDVHRLLAEWRAARIENIDLTLQLELNRIDDLVKEAWEAWDKSKRDYERKKAKQQGTMGDGGGGSNVTTTRVEQQKEEVICYGDPRYLDLINKLLVERRKLLGLYKPEQHELAGELTFANLLMQTGIIDDNATDEQQQ